MEDKNNLETFLTEKMSANQSGIAGPDPRLVLAARNKALARKVNKEEKPDIFISIAVFLNFKIKLNHAMVLLLFFGTCLMYLKKNELSNYNGNGRSGDLCDMVSVQSSTVLPSVPTFVANN